MEKLFEGILWRSRLVVLVAVGASLIAALCVFTLATIEVGHLVQDLVAYTTAHAVQRSQIITDVVEVVDGYLLGTIMLIFALGLYELFISRIDAAEGSEFAERLLLIRSLDDLKDRLTKVVLLILVVRFFEYALELHVQSPLDLLYLAVGIFLVAAAVWLSHGKSHAH